MIEEMNYANDNEEETTSILNQKLKILNQCYQPRYNDKIKQEK